MTGNSMKDFSSENKIDKPSQLKRIYIKPEIIHEMVLETRAGTVIIPVVPPGVFGPPAP
jgi:hypothetical protein